MFLLVTIRHGAQFLNTLVQLSMFTSARAQRAAAVVFTPDWKAKEAAVVICGPNRKMCRAQGSRGMRWDGFVIEAIEHLSGELDPFHLPHSSFSCNSGHVKQVFQMCGQVNISKANLNLGSLFQQPLWSVEKDRLLQR